MTHTATTAAPPQRVLLAIVTLPLFFGCGGGPFDYVPASGRVTYEDGQPLRVGKVIFKSMAPAVGGAHPRPAGADLNPDGTFDSVTSHKPGDGLVPGKHTVAIMFAVDENGNSLVPAEYTNIATTPITVDTADAPFQITIPRPQALTAGSRAGCGPACLSRSDRVRARR